MSEAHAMPRLLSLAQQANASAARHAEARAGGSYDDRHERLIRDIVAYGGSRPDFRSGGPLSAKVIYKVWGCPEKDPKGEFHSPIRFTTASTAPSFLFLSLLNLYKCAAKRKAQAKRAPRCAAEKTKSMR